MTKTAFVGICYDGPWKGQFLAFPTRFTPCPGGEYCNDGVGFWHFVEIHAT
jgi:hypothetical protein